MKRMDMKKLFLLAFATLMMTVLLSCSSDESSDGDGSDSGNTYGGQESEVTTLTVKNASSYTLYDVKWCGEVIFSAAGIAPGASAKGFVSEGFGYVYFSFYPNNSDVKMLCYTVDALDISNGDVASFTFTNNTVVVQLDNVGNKKTLDKIHFPSNALLSLTFDGRVVEKNDVIDLGKIVTNTEKSAEFSMTNGGTDLLRFVGNAPVTSSDGCIKISSQPGKSTLQTNSSEVFKISCSSSAVGSYTSDILIASNDETSPYTFTVKYTVAEPMPELSIQYGEETVCNEGTVDFGQVILEKSKTIEIFLLNTGTKKLTLTGSPSVSLLNDSDCFEIISQPIPEISAGNSSKCMIRYTPTQEGEESAILKIASDDPEKENTYIYLKGSGLKVYPSFTVYKSTTSTTSSNIVRENSTITYSAKTRKDNTASWSFGILNTDTEVNLRLSVGTETENGLVSISKADEVIAPGKIGSFTVVFNPDGNVGTFSEKIILTTNCETPDFSFKISFTSRELGTEALLFAIDNFGGVISPVISPNEKNYTVTFDSWYDTFSIKLGEITCSPYASVYFDGIPVEQSYKDFSLYDGKSYEMKIVSEDKQRENVYTFTFATKDNYDDTSFSKFYLKTTSGVESDITTSLASGIYYTKNYIFYLKPILNNPNAQVYIGPQVTSVDKMYRIENNAYSPKINLMDYDGVLSVAILSESEMEVSWFSIIAE
ncbi:MAG: DUF1573 domain-containing protein [Treponemataceae bacterium]|nr:DUF1573 domain-containing protein [Treponemataceae bacterium]